MRASLVPLTLHKPLLEHLQMLSGVSVPAVISAGTETVSAKACYSPTEVCPSRQCCNFPVTGNLVNIWALTYLLGLDLASILDEQLQEHNNQSLKYPGTTSAEAVG